MSAKSSSVTVRETHGMLRLGVKVSASSDTRGWSSLYASEQLEIPSLVARTAVHVISALASTPAAN